MSDVRKHLDAAKSEYRSQRYPGNLAEELLSAPRRRILPWTIMATAVTGLAAAVLVWVGVHNHPNSNKSTGVGPVAMVTEQPIEQPEASLSAALTTQPIYVEVAPPGQLVLPPVSDHIQLNPSNSEEMSVPAMPSMPGLFYASDASSSSSNSTS